MTPFEKFVAQEYGRKQGDDVSDIYDEARARWRQMQSRPVDENARAAQGMFASLPEPEPVSQAMIGEVPAPAQNYSGTLDLLTPANRTVFDNLPDSSGLRQEQAREMEIAQRQASGAEGAGTQPQSLPPELVHQAWRLFADDYRDFTVRTDGPMKSEMRQNLVDEYTRGFAENYAPVLGVTLAEAQAIADNARKESRPIQPSDWMGDTAAAPQVNLREVNDLVTAARGLKEMGREEQAQALLDQVPGARQKDDAFTNSMSLLSESDQLQRSLQVGRWTDPQSGTVLGRDEIEARIAENQNKLSGYSSALATYPTQEGVVVNVDQMLQDYTEDDGTILPSRVTQMNAALASKAKENPNLMVISNGLLAPASGFQYEISPDKDEAAPAEEKTTPGLENIAVGVGRAARSAAPIAGPVAQTYLAAYVNALQNLPPARAMREAETLKKAAPYIRGAISGVKRGFSGQ